MLNGVIVVGALTAVCAGIAGAWSPCGFSMVDTIGTALGDARRSAKLLAAATFAIGALAGGAVTFGGLALAGHLTGHGSTTLRDALAGAMALAAAFADWRGWRIAPQIRRQVPERWRWIMPLPLASSLYGLLLGLGFTTFVLSFATWALAGMSFAAGRPLFGVIVGVAFGIGRALPVLWLAPRLGTPAGDQGLERLALEPRLWLGMRRLDAIGLSMCAALLGTSSALAAPSAVYATDPSVDGATRAWERIGGPGVLVKPSHERMLAGDLPAVGGGKIAWVAADAIVIATRTLSGPRELLPLPPGATVDALAVSARWLVIRDTGSNGIANLFAASLDDLTQHRYLAGSATPGAIGRPTIAGSVVAYSYSTRRGSWIYEADLVDGRRTVLRSAPRDVQYANPALHGGRLLYERTDRCAQELRLGAPASEAHDRVLLTLPSTVLRDPGYQAGYIKDYNSASRCPNRGPGAGGSTTLGPTALGSTTAYVSESPSALAHTTIVAVKLG